MNAALREEERIAWQRLVRVLSHEINNSLTPISSIAGSLRARFSHETPASHGHTPSRPNETDGQSNLRRGLLLIEERALYSNEQCDLYESPSMPDYCPRESLAFPLLFFWLASVSPSHS